MDDGPRVTTLRRPRTREEADAFGQAMRLVFEQLGIERGQAFTIAKAHVEETDTGQARRTDGATAQAAAKLPGRGTQRWTVLEKVYASGRYGMTSSEIAEETGIPYRSVTPRIGELKAGGWVMPNGTTRKSDMNADSEVIVATLQTATELGIADEDQHLFDVPATAVKSPANALDL